MYRKVIGLISLVLVLLLAGNTPAAETYIWDNGGEGELWSVPENWDPDGIPTSEDTARINIPDGNCVIDSSVAAECSTVQIDSNSCLNITGGILTCQGNITVGNSSSSNDSVLTMNSGTADSVGGRLWIGTNGTGTLIMNGGEMSFYDKIEIGKNASGVGSIYMYGGTLNFDGNGNSTDLEIAKYGTGAVYMYGGVMNIEDQIKLGEVSGNASLYLYGGTINVSNLRGTDQVAGNPLLDITEGTLILTDNDVEVVNDYINRGWLVGYGGLGLLNVTYTAEPNQTTVTATNLPPELAWNPGPRNKSTAERPSGGFILTWEPGIYAGSHDVYFGTDPNAVNDANNVPGLWPEFKGNQDTRSFDVGPLELGQSYYWRIDEVNESDPNSPWKGIVWEFTVADYLVVDDFESYDLIDDGTGNMVYFTWIDGYDDPSTNGSTIGNIIGNSLETNNVHGGQQSAPLLYNNSVATYSEVTVNLGDLGIGPDLTTDDLQTLSLWFYGGPNNSAEQLYVKLNGSRVDYSDTLLNLKLQNWQEWRIDLADFGIDLSNVTELAIGLDRAGIVGGTGTLLIDDIRLYKAQNEEEI
jgi:hypothetical protein